MKNYFNYWGKSKKNVQEEITFHPLAYHSLDVAAVGCKLIEKHAFWQQQFCKHWQLAPEKLEKLVAFLLALHDLGKFSHKFQSQRQEYPYFDPYVKSGKIDLTPAHRCHHTLISQQIIDSKEVTEQLTKLLSLEEQSANFFNLLETAVFHHGRPPCTTSTTTQKFYSSVDLVAINEFIQDSYKLFTPSMPKQMDKNFRNTSSWIFAGFVVLCDWLGSQDKIFSYHQNIKCLISLEEYWQIALKRAEQAISESGILHIPLDLINLKPSQIWYKLKNLRPLQECCAQVELPANPQLWLIEDLTGSGKTEAALMLAYRLMSANDAKGLYFALPTMATANAMYKRVSQFCDALFPNAKPSLVLAHSQSGFHETFQESVWKDTHDIQETTMQELTASAYCSQWLAESAKRALLAQIGVGTIDQLLQGVLCVKHQALRLLGTFGKVIIIDEVHAYDEYMNRLLEVFLHYHAMMGGSAILLSATLTAKQRERLLRSFERDPMGAYDDMEIDYEQAVNTHYPAISMITYHGKKQQRYLQAIAAGEPRILQVKTLDSIKDAVELIKITSIQNKCICWIRNTVNEAIETYQMLLKEDWIDPNKIRLVHARFTVADRNHWEKQLINDFGDKSNYQFRAGQIVIATQVVEQSLDVDFDVVISDLAPIDLLIQRAGRLQRHRRDAQGNINSIDERSPAIFYVLGPPALQEVAENWPAPLLNKLRKIYPDTGILWRTMWLCEHQPVWDFPQQIRELMEKVYHDDSDLIMPKMLAERHYREQDGVECAFRQHASNNLLKLTAHYCKSNEHDGWGKRVSSRIIELETCPVYLFLATEKQPWAYHADKPMREIWEGSKVNVPIYAVSKMRDFADESDMTQKYPYLQDEIILSLVYDAAQELYIGRINGGKRNYQVTYSAIQGFRFT